MILDEIVADKRARLERRPPIGLDELMARLDALPPARPFAAALTDASARAPRAIAEFKRRSPSAGAIRPGADAAATARAYEAAGARALSVLTDERFFGGSLDDLTAARAATRLPVLRKDFLLDERDVYETRLAGADAALLIVRLLAPAELAALVQAAARAGLGALVEAHTEREIETALAAGARIIGVNHRDLDTLAIDFSLSARARALCGPSAIVVAESGVHSRDQVAELRARAVDALLVGESLMRAPDPGLALAELIA